MLNKVWFRTGIALLILFLLIKLVMEVHSVFTPFIIILQSVLLPLLLSGFLFYICLPFQKILEKNKIPRWGSITLIFIGLIIIIGVVIGYIGPLIAEQIENLINQIPGTMFWLGVGDAEHGLHDSHLAPDESAIAPGVHAMIKFLDWRMKQ